MADQELNVKIKAIDEATVVLNGVQKSTQKLTDELQREKKALLGVDKQSKSARQSLKKFGKDTKALGQKVSGTINRVSSLKNAMMGLAAVGAIKWAIGAIKEAAAFEGQLASLGPNMEATEERLKKLQKATGNIFSIESLVNAEAKLKALGVPLKLTPKLLTNLAGSAATMGITTEHAMDSLSTGLARMSKPILDNLGITYNATQVFDAYGASINKAGDELTEHEKKLAIVAEAQRQLESSTTQLPESLRQTMEMTAAWNDAMLEMKRALVDFAPFLTWFVKAMVSAAQKVKAAWEVFDPKSGRLQGIVQSATGAAPKLSGHVVVGGKKMTLDEYNAMLFGQDIATGRGEKVGAAMALLGDKIPGLPKKTPPGKTPPGKKPRAKKDTFFEQSEKGALAFAKATTKAVGGVQRLFLEEEQSTTIGALKIEQAKTLGDLQKKMLGFEIQRLQLEFKLSLETNSAKRMQIETELELLGIMEKQALAAERKKEEVKQIERLANAFNFASSAMGQFSTKAAGILATYAELTVLIPKMTQGGKEQADAVKAGIGVVGTGVASFIEGEREKAAVLALMETARGVASFPNVATMAAHFSAAAMFGLVAGGVIGGGASAGASGAKEAVEESQRRAGPQGGQAQIVVNYNNGIILGGKQTIGRAIAEATGTVSKTGQMASAF